LEKWVDLYSCLTNKNGGPLQYRLIIIEIKPVPLSAAEILPSPNRLEAFE
jgi:hypothetical protein